MIVKLQYCFGGSFPICGWDGQYWRMYWMLYLKYTKDSEAFCRI